MVRVRAFVTVETRTIIPPSSSAYTGRFSPVCGNGTGARRGHTCSVGSHLKMETEALSETLCFLVIYNSGRWTKPTNPLSLTWTCISSFSIVVSACPHVKAIPGVLGWSPPVLCGPLRHSATRWRDGVEPPVMCGPLRHSATRWREGVEPPVLCGPLRHSVTRWREGVEPPGTVWAPETQIHTVERGSGAPRYCVGP
jgi:hypothetical protein